MRLAELRRFSKREFRCRFRTKRFRSPAPRPRACAGSEGPRLAASFDNSAVDGYAVRFADLDAAGETRLEVRGYRRAGHGGGEEITPGAAVRIFTGAPMPPEPIRYSCRRTAGRRGAHVVLSPGLKAGANRRFAGEDVALGFARSCGWPFLRPQDIALAARWASLASRSIRVKVAVFSTGDEVVDGGGERPSHCDSTTPTARS